MKTIPEIKQTIANHLLKQMEKSVDEAGTKCMYRGKNGMKCAVGAVIDDDCYEARIENLTVTSRQPELMAVLECSGINVHNAGVFYALVQAQYIHDSVPSSHWPDRLAAWLTKDHESVRW